MSERQKENEVKERMKIKGEGERNGRRMVLCATAEPAAG